MPRVEKKTIAPRPAAPSKLAEKQVWPGATLLSPVPAVLVSCGGFDGIPANLITIAWAGTVCSQPPMLSISVRPERHSYGILKKTGEFVVNIPTADQARVTDWCGVVSGRNEDKFAKTGLTPVPASSIRTPGVRECPLNLECRIVREIELGSHSLFLAEISAVQAASALIDDKGRLNLEDAGLLAYAHGHYFSLGKCLGHFGFSVRKKPGPSVRK